MSTNSTNPIPSYTALNGAELLLADAAVDAIVAGNKKLVHIDSTGASIPLLNVRSANYAVENTTRTLLIGQLAGAYYFWWNCNCGGRPSNLPKLTEIL